MDKIFAAPYNANVMLIIDPVANTATTLGGLGSEFGKWTGVMFAESVKRLFGAPFNATAVLIVGFAVNSNALLPFRLVAELTNTVTSTQAATLSTHAAFASTQSSTQTALSSMQDDVLSSQVSQSSTEAVLMSTQTSLQSTHVSLLSTQVALEMMQDTILSMQADLVSTQTVLNTVSETVCNQPVCSAGTQAVNGTCVPDCLDLRRRGVACEPFCDDANVITPSDDGGTSASWSVPIEFIGGLCAVIFVAIVGIAVYRRRSGRRGAVAMRANQDIEMSNLTAIVDRMPRHAQGASYETPITLNPAYAATGDAKFAKAVDFEELGPTYEDIDKVTVKLDGDLYVQGGSASSAMYESVL
jgi:hypothetical protein